MVDINHDDIARIEEMINLASRGHKLVGDITRRVGHQSLS
jgi:hypothetical protein